jgi:hypothetical protein
VQSSFLPWIDATKGTLAEIRPHPDLLGLLPPQCVALENSYPAAAGNHQILKKNIVPWGGEAA